MKGIIGCSKGICGREFQRVPEGFGPHDGQEGRGLGELEGRGRAVVQRDGEGPGGGFDCRGS